ncbi:hypothetical protein ABT246_16045 [Streptomyces sp. NPDC001553]|uniref:hypothetical protein n=1 Tax=Streptomyces sp. NPDC001553 TaxID=3154385 RepID=UPI0033241A20
MTDDQILLGLTLTVLLAVGSQILAARLRVPALIVLLPVGFAAGALTDVIHPARLMGANFSALVSLAVAVILYDAGLDRSREGGTAGHGHQPGARLEGVTAVLLATDDDDFNALASVVMESNVEGHVYRVGPPHGSHGVVAPYTGGDILFGTALVRHVLAQRYEEGARFVVRPASSPRPPASETLFVIRADRRLEPVTEQQRVTPHEGDSVVLLVPGLSAEPAGGAPPPPALP